MYSSGLPLLIKGYNSDSNGTNDSLPPTALTLNWNNYFDSGRGDVIALDVIQTSRINIGSGNTGANVTLSVGGIQVLTNADSGDFAIYAFPGNYYITPLKQPGGQTLQLNLSGGSGNNGLQVLAFYENRFDTPEHVAKLMSSKLKRRYIDTFTTITTNAKNQVSSTFTVPTGQGNVIGIQLLGYAQTGSNFGDLQITTYSVYVNGVSIFENVLASYGNQISTRPQIFPILINEGDTYYFNVDSSRLPGATNFKIGARLYFDDNN